MSNPAAGGPAPDPEFRSAHAIREALPTRAHAEMFFGMVADHLGDEAWVESWNGDASRTIFRREPAGSRSPAAPSAGSSSAGSPSPVPPAPDAPWLVPWPLVSVARGGREGPSPIMTAVPGVYLEPAIRPGAAPKIRGLGPGQVTIHDGSQYVTVCYGGDGRWFECSVSAPPQEALAGVVAALAAKTAAPPEIVASFAAALDLRRHGPGRVLLPARLPHGVQGAWNCGLFAIRDALFAGRVPEGARWVAADGWTGRAIAFGPTRDAAVASWRTEVARVRPFPERPKPPAEPLPEPSLEQSFDGEQFSMRVTMRGPSSGVPWVEPTPENSPAIVLPVPDAPDRASPLGAWVRLADAFGNVRPTAIRREGRGFTLVGDALAGRDLGDLDAQLDAADRAWDARPIPKFELPPGFPEPPPVAFSVRQYRFVDDRTRVPVKPSVVSASRRRAFDAKTFDAEQFRWHVVRVREDRSPA